MLAKVWKRVLLVICIIACLFNIMSKLINKKSLQAQLDSVKDGVSLSEVFSNTDTNENMTNHEYNTSTYNAGEENTLNTTIRIEY